MALMAKMLSGRVFYTLLLAGRAAAAAAAALYDHINLVVQR